MTCHATKMASWAFWEYILSFALHAALHAEGRGTGSPMYRAFKWPFGWRPSYLSLTEALASAVTKKPTLHY